MTTTTTTTPPPTGQAARRARRVCRTAAVLGATAAAFGSWLVAVPLTGVELTVRQGGATTTVGPGAVVAAALVAGLAGWASLAVLERLHAPARAVWTATAAVVLMLSLAGPLSNGTGAPATATLVCLHLLVGAVLIAMLRRTARR